MDKALHTQSINAAIVNISGRQRMLCQRAAMLCLKLVGDRDPNKRRARRQDLQHLTVVMERSHRGLIHGDDQLKLPGNPSDIVKAMYFKPPFSIDQQMRRYIATIHELLAASDAELTLDNPTFQEIIDAASEHLLLALDAVVNQYQRESDAEQQAIQDQQLELYRQSCEAAEAAQTRAHQLQQALAELHQTQAQLIQTEKMSSLGQLTAGIAHEINNPINFIHGNLQYVQDYMQGLLEMVELYQQHYPQTQPAIQTHAEAIDLDFLQKDLPKILGSMEMGTNRICQIVSSLRNFSRTDEADLKAVNIHEGIDNTLLILQHRLKHHRPGIQLLKQYESELPPIECYPGQLNQCLMNLITNAIDAIEESVQQPVRPAHTDTHSPAHFKQITIQTSKVGADWVQIMISDNGTGIPHEIQQRIFDPFFTTKDIGKGTGMGLAISHQIITERHGGRLICCSTEGQGTVFRIQIPIWQQVRQAA